MTRRAVLLPCCCSTRPGEACLFWPAMAAKKTSNPAKNNKTPAKKTAMKPGTAKATSKPAVPAPAGGALEDAVKPAMVPASGGGGPSTNDLDEQEKNVTLDEELARVGEPDAKLRERVFALTPEDALLELGTSVESQNIIDDVPLFTRVASRALERMTSVQRASLVGFEPGLLGLIVHETVALRQMAHRKKGRASGAVARKLSAENKLKGARGEAIQQRNLAYDGLRNAIGLRKDLKKQLDGAVGVADTPELLRAGLAGLARFIDEMSKDALVAPLLEPFGVGAARAVTLRNHIELLSSAEQAAKVAVEDRVSQRELDVQDGRVLHLLRLVYRAFKAAQDHTGTVIIPPLRRVGWLVAGRTSSKSEQPSTPSPPTPQG
jgi:hypothetical protein